MLAIDVRSPGDLEVLRTTEIPIPKPTSEQILVHVKATGLNRADLLQRRGKYSPPPGESTILGLEIAGEVAEIGDRVTQFKIGDRVFGLVGSGAYAEYCVIDQMVAMPIPTSLSFIQAAAIPEAFLTASEAIFTLGELINHQSILFHAGGSGVATAGIQLAKQLNADIFATVGSDKKKQKLNELFHLKNIINYKADSFLDEIQKITNNKGVDVIIDVIGGSYFLQNIKCLKPKGRLIIMGLMGGIKSEIDLNLVLRQRLQIKGLIMRSRPLAEKRHMTQNFIQKWLPLFDEGKLKPVIDSIFSFNDVQAAHQRMEERANFGKIILEW